MKVFDADNQQLIAEISEPKIIKAIREEYSPESFDGEGDLVLEEFEVDEFLSILEGFSVKTADDGEELPCTSGHEARCLYALSSDCNCQCGGRNHGAGLKPSLEKQNAVIAKILEA